MPQNKYTLEQRVFIFETFIKTKSTSTVRKRFMRKFSGQPIPCRDTVRKLVMKFRNSGSLLDKKPKRKRRVLTEEKLDEICARLEKTRYKSLRCLAEETGISKSSARNAIKLRVYNQEHPRVHFGEDADSFGKDNEIVIKGPNEGKITAHLGFLQVGHRYEILLSLPRSLLQVSESTEIQESQHHKVPNVNCKFLNLAADKKNLNLKIELFAYKEKLLKEELHLECCDQLVPVISLAIMARVLGRGKGTPLLKNGIKCIGVELEDESEASDWQGFE